MNLPVSQSKTRFQHRSILAKAEAIRSDGASQLGTSSAAIRNASPSEATIVGTGKMKGKGVYGVSSFNPKGKGDAIGVFSKQSPGIPSIALLNSRLESGQSTSIGSSRHQEREQGQYTFERIDPVERGSAKSLSSSKGSHKKLKGKEMRDMARERTRKANLKAISKYNSYVDQPKSMASLADMIEKGLEKPMKGLQADRTLARKRFADAFDAAQAETDLLYGNRAQRKEMMYSDKLFSDRLSPHNRRKLLQVRGLREADKVIRELSQDLSPLVTDALKYSAKQAASEWSADNCTRPFSWYLQRKLSSPKTLKTFGELQRSPLKGIKFNADYQVRKPTFRELNPNPYSNSAGISSPFSAFATSSNQPKRAPWNTITSGIAFEDTPLDILLSRHVNPRDKALDRDTKPVKARQMARDIPFLTGQFSRTDRFFEDIDKGFEAEEDRQWIEENDNSIEREKAHVFNSISAAQKRTKDRNLARKALGHIEQTLGKGVANKIQQELLTVYSDSVSASTTTTTSASNFTREKDKDNVKATKKNKNKNKNKKKEMDSNSRQLSQFSSENYVLRSTPYPSFLQSLEQAVSEVKDLQDVKGEKEITPFSGLPVHFEKQHPDQDFQNLNQNETKPLENLEEEKHQLFEEAKQHVEQMKRDEHTKHQYLDYIASLEDIESTERLKKTASQIIQVDNSQNMTTSPKTKKKKTMKKKKNRLEKVLSSWKREEEIGAVMPFQHLSPHKFQDISQEQSFGKDGKYWRQVSVLSNLLSSPTPTYSSLKTKQAYESMVGRALKGQVKDILHKKDTMQSIPSHYDSHSVDSAPPFSSPAAYFSSQQRHLERERVRDKEKDQVLSSLHNLDKVQSLRKRYTKQPKLQQTKQNLSNQASMRATSGNVKYFNDQTNETYEALDSPYDALLSR